MIAPMGILIRRLLQSPPVPLRVALLSVVTLAYGATGFLYFELPVHPSLGWMDAIWYAVVTVTTVGYGDFAPVTVGGRFVVALPLMFFGIGLLGYVLSVAASTLIEAKAKETHGMGSFDLKDHLLIVNFPGVAKVERILDELALDASIGRRKPVIVVDEDLTELPPAIAERGVHYIRGPAARDETLTRANADHASHVIILSKRPGDPRSDGENLAITLAIEARSRKVISVVECVDLANEELFRKAGADRIVCASRFDAHFVSHELLNPGVQDVVGELTTNQRGQQLFISPCPVGVASYAAVCEHASRSAHLAIGIRRGRETLLNPEPTFEVGVDDEIISIGAQRMPSTKKGAVK
jgi:voltage-gated potassium channel